MLGSNLLRLRGTARRIGDGDGPLAGHCELAVRHKKQRHVIDGKLELVDDAGEVTVLAIAGGDVLGHEERRAPYRDLAAEPGVAAIGLRPDPAIEVVLRTAWILDGKPIEVLAVREPDGLRALAAGPHDALDAWAAAQQREAERRRVLPQRTKLPWDIIVPLALVIVIIALAEVSVLFGAHLRFMAPSIAVTIAAAAVGILWDQVKLPKFDEREHKHTGLFATLAILLGIAINLTPESPLGEAIQGALVLGVGVFGLVREARAVRLARALVAAPSQAPEDGKPGVFVGKVGDDTPEQFFSQLIAVGAIHTIRKQAKAGAKKTVETERKGFDTTFQVQLPAATLEIDPKDATWSSELRNKRETWSVFLPVDAAIVVAGTPVRDGKKLVLRATGKDSLVFYGVPGDEDPQAVLRRKLALHQLTYGALFMVVALAAAIAAHGYVAAR